MGKVQQGQLEKRLSYTFKNQSLLCQALTHPSIAASKRASDFERLEFLGDRVLGLVIAQEVYDRYPDEPEGDLAKRLAALVSRDTCRAVADALGLLSYLHVTADIRPSSSVQADAMEALIGALYLDGGLEAAAAVIHDLWETFYAQDIRPPKDAKTTLQEWGQARGLPLPQYTVLSTEGPPHSPVFTIEVSLENGCSAQGVGASKRQAEQSAAESFLKDLSDKD